MTGQEWYHRSFRRNLVDMHIDGWNPDFLSRFDPRAYFDCLKTARIQSPMIYTHSHAGYCNWDSASGEVHPAFKGNNRIRALFDLCHADGMDVVAYYSLIYNNRVYAAHPDWRMIDAAGRGSREWGEADAGSRMMNGRGRYGLICPNNPDYRDFLQRQFAELCDAYPFEGIFLDMTFWPMVCLCNACRMRFRTETGLEAPVRVDWTDGKWLRFQAAREDWLGEFARFATAELKRLRPGISVEHQFSTLTHPWTFGVRTAISDASDYSGGDLYGGLEQQSFICKAYYGLSRNQPFEYMTSRCDPGLFDHTTTKSLEMLKQHAYLTYAHHGAFLAIDAIDPRGTLNRQFYQTLGEVFRETIPYEPFFTGTLSAGTALYFNTASKMDPEMKHPLPELPDETQHHLQATLGAAKALRQAHIPYAVVTDGRLADIRRHPLLILSDPACMTSFEEDAMMDYVRQGGCLCLCGTTPARLAKELLGLEVTGRTVEKITYIRPTEAGQPFFTDMYNAGYPMAVFDRQMLATVATEAGQIILGRTTLPYTDPADLAVFASIHSNPPGRDTDNPALVLGQYGRGRVLWSSAAFAKSEQPVHKQVFANLVRMLCPDVSTLCTDAPAHIEMTVFDDPVQHRTLFHAVNVQELHPASRTGPFKVSLHCGHPVAGIVSLPDSGEVMFDQQEKDGPVKFEVDGLDLFRMLAIEWQ
jgi:hypothetical protein